MIRREWSLWDDFGDKMKLVIDTDPGVDDAMAIFYAALVPELELVGLTTIFGNVTTAKATRNALRLIEYAGLDIPVAQGADGPLSGRMTVPADFVHGAEGFGDIPAAVPQGSAVDLSAARLLCQLAREHRGELVVCAIGPITNVALAIQLDPEFATNVARIVFMGGAYSVPGNVTRFAEANTWNDPEALNIVINSGANVVMVGLDVTMQTMCDPVFFDGLARVNPKLGGFLQDASHFYLDFHHSRFGQKACPLHDPAAVIACTHPELFEMANLPIAVVESGEQVGRTILSTDGIARSIAVCVDGDMEAVKARFAAAFGRN